MFKKKRFGNVIINDQGFEVHIDARGRDSLIYKEGDKVILINSESSVVKNKIIIAFWKNSIKNWESPYEKEIIGENKCNQISDNIEAALKYAGFDQVEVIKG